MVRGPEPTPTNFLGGSWIPRVYTRLPCLPSSPPKTGVMQEPSGENAWNLRMLRWTDFIWSHTQTLHGTAIYCLHWPPWHHPNWSAYMAYMAASFMLAASCYMTWRAWHGLTIQSPMQTVSSSWELDRKRPQPENQKTLHMSGECRRVDTGIWKPPCSWFETGKKELLPKWPLSSVACMWDVFYFSIIKNFHWKEPVF